MPLVEPLDPALIPNVVTNVPVIVPDQNISSLNTGVVSPSQSLGQGVNLIRNNVEQEPGQESASASVTLEQGGNVYITNINEYDEQNFISVTNTTGGVTSLNSLTGGLDIVAGSNVTVTALGNSITVAASVSLGSSGYSGYSGAAGAPGASGVSGYSGSSASSLYEVVTGISGATGVVVHNFALGPVFNHTSIAANFTANITNLNLNAGYATNVVLILNQGATPYVPNAVQIAGVAQSINWQGGSAPSGNANKKDIVSFSITNLAGTYTVLGQLVSFG